jgi:predicted PhzF superfamily epimerase YddE/YHI9
LGGWWQGTQGDAPLHATVRQGTAIARPNVLTLDMADGNIQVGGRVIEIGAGDDGLVAHNDPP